MTAPAQAHPIEAAIAGLVAIWDGAPELRFDVDGVETSVLVSDNPLLDETIERRTLLVGTSAQYLPGGAQAATSYDLGGEQRVQVDVVCELRVWSGNTDAAAERHQALGVVVTLEQLLARDRNLGGTADWARVTRTTYEPDEIEQGASATVEITVRVDTTRDIFE